MKQFPMRIVTAVVVLAALVVGIAFAQEAASGKQPPTDQDAISMVGARVAKVFARFGAPADISAVDVTSDEPKVCLDYGAFGYLVDNKTVRACMFWPDWTGNVCGVKLGDSADAAIKKLGKPESTSKANDGTQKMYWNYKANDEIMSLQLSFNKDQKCTRVSLSVQ